MVPSNIKDEIDRMIERLVARYKPDLVVLFGSAARGEFGEDSDVDLLIVKKTRRRPIWRRVDARKAMDARIPVDVIVYSPSEFERLVRDVNSFVSQVIEEGTVLYKRDTAEE